VRRRWQTETLFQAKLIDALTYYMPFSLLYIKQGRYLFYVYAPNRVETKQLYHQPWR